MVHKMQRMALSSHQLVAPAASAAEKADSENTRNSDNNGDPEEEAQQGDWITHQHNWTKLNRKQDWETHATHTNTENRHTKGWAGSNTRGRGKTHRACVYVNILSCGRWRDMSSTFTNANAFIHTCGQKATQSCSSPVTERLFAAPTEVIFFSKHTTR